MAKLTGYDKRKMWEVVNANGDLKQQMPETVAQQVVVEDPNSVFTGTNVETVLKELYDGIQAAGQVDDVQNSGGTSLVTNKIATVTPANIGAEPTLTTQTSYSNKGSASKTITISTNTKGQVTSITEQSIQVTESQVTNLSSDLQNIREVAEGKSKSFILSYSKTSVTSSTFTANTYYKADGTLIQNWTAFSSYITYSGAQLPCVNNAFHTNDDIISLGHLGYLIINKDRGISGITNDTYTILPLTDPATSNLFKKGDVFLIIELDIPDRWVGGMAVGASIIPMYKLETSKIDLTSYVNAASDGLTLQSGSTGQTVKHTNSVAALTTAGFNKHTYDAQGHITGSSAVAETDITNKFSHKGSSTKFIYIDSNGVVQEQAVPTIPSITISTSGSGNFVKNITSSGHTITKTLGNISNSDLPNSGISAGTYSAVQVNAKGIATSGGQIIEFGISGQTAPSASLVVGGLFFELSS